MQLGERVAKVEASRKNDDEKSVICTEKCERTVNE